MAIGEPVDAESIRRGMTRAAHYRRAEQIAIGQDLALIPLWYRTEYPAFNASRRVGVNNDFFENPTLRTIGLK